MSKASSIVVFPERIENKIFLIRGRKVMLDKDLAELYGIETKRLNEQVRRNLKRFPEDFMFQLAKEDSENLRSQIATSSWGGQRYASFAFTEQGVAMLSSVLNSDRAIEVNIIIMRAFVKLREILFAHKELNQKLEALERKVGKHDVEIQLILKAIRDLMAPPPEKPKPGIGFHVKY